MVNDRTQFACVPKRVYDVNRLLLESRIDGRWSFINDSCFRGLLRIGSQPVSVAATLHLIEAWDIDARCFNFLDGRVLEITPERVASVYGLPCGQGKDLITKEMLTGTDDFCEEIRVRLRLCGKGDTYVDWKRLITLLHSERWNEEMDVLDYWRLYCLLCIGAVLIPIQNSRVRLRYLSFFHTKEMANSFNWALLIQERLVAKLSPGRAISNATDSMGSRPGGNFHCITHIFYDFVESKSGTYYTCSIGRSLKMADVVKYVGQRTDGSSTLGGQAADDACVEEEPYEQDMSSKGSSERREALNAKLAALRSQLDDFKRQEGEILKKITDIELLLCSIDVEEGKLVSIDIKEEKLVRNRAEAHTETSKKAKIKQEDQG